jgi:hypothetical protein
MALLGGGKAFRRWSLVGGFRLLEGYSKRVFGDPGFFLLLSFIIIHEVVFCALSSCGVTDAKQEVIPVNHDWNLPKQ